jgi:hypothetical protein
VLEQKTFTDLGTQVLSKSENGKRIIISEQVDKLQKKGFAAEEVLDILASNDINNINLIETVVNEKFGKFSSSKTQNIRESYVCPTSFSEVKNIVEDKLFELGPVNFINRLARSESPIMPVNDKSYNSYLRLATAAVKDNNVNLLFPELKKWFEEAMYLAVCAAKSNKNEIRVASNNSSYSATVNNRIYNVNLKEGICDCSKFTKSNYADFGLACEHIVAASEKASPHQRLLKAVKEASKIEDEEQFEVFDVRSVFRS